MHRDLPLPACPCCDHTLNQEEVDLAGVMPVDDDYQVICPVCESVFLIRVATVPVYTSAFCPEQIDYDL